MTMFGVDRVLVRLTASPMAREGAAQGLEIIAKGLESGIDKVEVYKGLVTYAAALAYGEQGLGIDWSQPPVLGEREEVYLRALETTADRFNEGDLGPIQVELANLDGVLGSHVDIVGLVCAPELAIVVGVVKHGLESTLTGAEVPRDVLWRRGMASGIRSVVGGYRGRSENRAAVAEALFDLTARIDQGFRF